MAHDYWLIIGVIALCYLIGSIPSAYLMGKFCYNLDIREHGSGNIGTMNTRLIMGWLPAVAVFAVDCGKGAIAACIAAYCGVDPLLGLAAAVSGHIWPVWLKFSGGKGLAAGLGGLLWSGQHLAIAVFVIAWLLVYALRRQDDVASACGAMAVAILALSTGP